ncbi:MAG: hypothetical protein K2Y31_06375 [Burkholderiales bacterium]|jgi:hypothetical protein|nr:hypothetical protein [Burkholderiales bacterium]
MSDSSKKLLNASNFVSDFCTVILIWTPLLWFIGEHRTASGGHNGEPTLVFEALSMGWADIALLALLCAASFLSQIRFILVRQDLMKFEALKRRHNEAQAFLRQQAGEKF